MPRLLALSICTLLSPTLAWAQSGWSDYANAAQSYRLSYPDGWEFKPPNANGYLFIDSPLDGASDTFRENVNFIRVQIDKPQTMAEMEADILKAVPAATPQFALLNKTYPKWSGRPAFQIVYSGLKSTNSVDYRIKILQRVLLVGNTAYVATYTAQAKDYDRYLPIVNRIVNSFRLD